jgi:hypothetical protein
VKRYALVVGLLLAVGAGVRAHDPGAAPISWNREVSRIVYERCASCHRDGGSSFSLLTYRDAQPRAAAIKEAVLLRRMPPWGAIKGFGHFRNDQGMTQEEIALVADWVEGGTTKGNNPNTLPPLPKFDAPSGFAIPANAIKVSGDLTLKAPLALDGVLPGRVPRGASVQIVAARPDGSVEPMLWLYQYEDRYRHPFMFRKRLEIPAGTVIRGVPRSAEILLIPAVSSTP